MNVDFVSGVWLWQGGVLLFIRASDLSSTLCSSSSVRWSQPEATGWLLIDRASLVAQMERVHLQRRRTGFDPWIRKIPWRRERQPTPVFLPEESQRQRSLAGYNPWGCIELDTTEWLIHTHDRFSPRLPLTPALPLWILVCGSLVFWNRVQQMSASWCSLISQVFFFISSWIVISFIYLAALGLGCGI